ncbi:MAG: VOC family protein [Isosphaeraceae bacterium]
MAVKPIPDGYHTVTPYLAVEGAGRLLEFLVKAFDAVAHECMKRPDGTIHHAQVKIGDSLVMLADASGPWKPRPSTLYLYVPDTDATYHRAIEAGATSLMEPVDQFYGDRNAGVQDPAGNFWWIATHLEDVSPEELQRRAEAHRQAAR